jgi:hypothetical protein
MTHVLVDSLKCRRWTRPHRLAGGGIFILLLAAVALAVGCGGSGASTGATPDAQASGQSMQVMATVTRGDLVETSIAPLQLTKNSTGGATGVGQLRSSSSVTVAKGQSVVVYFVQRPAGTGQFASPGTGQGSGSSAYPSPGAAQGSGSSAYPSPGTVQGSAQGGAFPGGGAGNFANAKHATATIDSVQKNSDGSLKIQVSIAKLPSGVKGTAFAMARLSSQVLAKDVLLLPREAVSGTGSNATVQVLVGGKTEKRHVVVGKQTQAQAEIASGVNEGDNVIYTRTFRGFGGGFGTARPGAGGYPQGSSSGGYPQGAPTGAPPTDAPPGF